MSRGVFLSHKPELIQFSLREVKLDTSARTSPPEGSGESVMELGSKLQLNKKDNCFVRLLFYSKLTFAALELLVASESRFKKSEEFTSEEVNSEETITRLTNMILSKHLDIVKSLVENSGYKISELPETIEEFKEQPPSDVESQAEQER